MAVTVPSVTEDHRLLAPLARLAISFQAAIVFKIAMLTLTLIALPALPVQRLHLTIK